jgi:DNA end-binding protein Ku
MKHSTAVAAAGAAAAAVTAGVVATKLLRDKPLAELSKAELYERAKSADIPGRSTMSKDELVAALGG